MRFYTGKLEGTQLLFSGFGATQKGYLLGAGIILRMSENGFGAIQKRVSSPVRSVSPLPAAIRIY